MNLLFLHNNFPAQFRHLAAALAGKPGNRVAFLTQHREKGEIPGVFKLSYQPAAMRQDSTAGLHPYLRPFQEAVLTGQGAYRALKALKETGFTPDVVIAHAGWGPALYLREVFPEARWIGYFEWYYRAHGGDSDFLDPTGMNADLALGIETRNAALLFDLAQCDLGLCPTRFQREQFPAVFQSKLTVLHDGIDTGYFHPEPGARFVLDGLDLSGADEIVTYATRGMEPYRGFPQFMRAAARLLARRPGLHVVVAGADRVVYGPAPADGVGYKERLLRELSGIDLSRLHFTGLLPYGPYRRLLQASSVHVYLSVPFVLSWSLLEALSCGCLVVASDTAPVREAIRSGENGHLVDFFSDEALAEKIEFALDHKAEQAPLRAAARAGIVEQYDLKKLLARQISLIEGLAAK